MSLFRVNHCLKLFHPYHFASLLAPIRIELQLEQKNVHCNANMFLISKSSLSGGPNSAQRSLHPFILSSTPSPNQVFTEWRTRAIRPAPSLCMSTPHPSLNASLLTREAERRTKSRSLSPANSAREHTSRPKRAEVLRTTEA